MRKMPRRREVGGGTRARRTQTKDKTISGPATRQTETWGIARARTFEVVSCHGVLGETYDVGFCNPLPCGFFSLTIPLSHGDTHSNSSHGKTHPYPTSNSFRTSTTIPTADLSAPESTPTTPFNVQLPFIMRAIKLNTTIGSSPHLQYPTILSVKRWPRSTTAGANQTFQLTCALRFVTISSSALGVSNPLRRVAFDFRV
ncbi:hypothetical protein BDN72DRAFT_966232 [Pluteus cervinus]|uniref:Uncharacterized protein n=1 Tax=Pluteus cervinus TaxID=181527 RepID=A0ACD2ZZ41_9AGAR|nr:hypothetical protein BDN72DRAFT_966232 [Pluteus cervinus]